MDAIITHFKGIADLLGGGACSDLVHTKLWVQCLSLVGVQPTVLITGQATKQ